MKYYTEIIPVTLAEKLKEKGMPIEMQPLYAQEAPNARGIVRAGVGLRCPSYAEVLDWLFSRYEMMILIVRHERKWDWWLGLATDKDTYECSVEIAGELSATWHEAANAAIEKALTLI